VPASEYSQPGYDFAGSSEIATSSEAFGHGHPKNRRSPKLWRLWAGGELPAPLPRER